MQRYQTTARTSGRQGTPCRWTLSAAFAALIVSGAVQANVVTVQGSGSCATAADLLRQGQPVTLRITGKNASAIGEHLLKSGQQPIDGRFAVFGASPQLLIDAFKGATTSVACAVSLATSSPWLFTMAYRLSLRYDRNGPSISDDELRMRFDRP